MRFTSSSNSIASAGSPVYFPYRINFIETTPCRVRLLSRTAHASIKLPPRRTPRILALLRLLLRLIRIKPTFLAAPDATMRPQTLKDHFRSGCGSRRVLTILNAEPPDVFHQPLNLRQLMVTIRSIRQLRHLQFSANLKPLNHRLKIDFGKMLA